MPKGGLLRRKKYLLMGRDAKFSEAFSMTLGQVAVEAVRLPPRAPNLSAHIERFMGSVKDECLRRLVIFGEGAPVTAAREFVSGFHEERNLQGLGNRLIEPAGELGRTAGEVVCRERPDGILRYYYRKAAQPGSRRDAPR